MNTIQQLEFNLNTAKNLYLMGTITEEHFKRLSKQIYVEAVQDIVSDDSCLSGYESVLRARNLANEVSQNILSGLFKKPEQEAYEII